MREQAKENYHDNTSQPKPDKTANPKPYVDQLQGQVDAINKNMLMPQAEKQAKLQILTQGIGDLANTTDPQAVNTKYGQILNNVNSYKAPVAPAKLTKQQQAQALIDKVSAQGQTPQTPTPANPNGGE